MHKRVFTVLVCICLLFTACSQDNSDELREAWTDQEEGDIYIGISYPVSSIESTTGFINGVNMAVDEVNQKGILGKKIKIIKKDDNGTVTTGAEIAQAFVDDSRISAVIGHWNSRVSNAVADIYNSNGVVMITPASTSPKLTKNGYSYIFRKINNDSDYGGTMARYAAKNGLKKIAVYYSDDDYGRELANAFEDEAYTNGIEVIDRTTSLNDRNVKDILKKWKAFDCDAVFIADVIPDALDVISLIRSEEENITILGSTGIDRSSFLDTMGSYAEGVVMPSVFNPNSENLIIQNFVDNYKEIYKEEPDTWAAQGYETVKVLCQAIETSGSAMPEDIAKALFKIKKYDGITGNLNCNSDGEIVGGNIYVKVVRNGKYANLGSY